MFSHDARRSGALAEPFATADCCVPLLCDGIGLCVACTGQLITHRPSP
jgi:hypothetical protein